MEFLEYYGIVEKGTDRDYCNYFAKSLKRVQNKLRGSIISMEDSIRVKSDILKNILDGKWEENKFYWEYDRTVNTEQEAINALNREIERNKHFLELYKKMFVDKVYYTLGGKRGNELHFHHYENI